MRLLILLGTLFVLSQASTSPIVGDGDTCDEANGWFRMDISCYQFFTTTELWDDAYAACRTYSAGGKTAHLIRFADATELASIRTQYQSFYNAGNQDLIDYCNATGNSCESSPGANYWTEGTPSGYLNDDSTTDPLPMECGSSCFQSNAAVLDDATGEWVVQFSGSPYLAWNAPAYKLGWVQDTESLGYICEYDLTTCNPNDDLRFSWPSTAKDVTAELACPSGYTGTATRYCDINLQFDLSLTDSCMALVGDAGWTHDNDGDDGTGGTYNNLDDGFGWDDPTAITGSATAGVEYRKSYALDSTSAEYTYVEVRYGITSSDFEGTFEFSVDINGTGDAVVHNSRSGNSVTADGEEQDIFIILEVASLPNNGVDGFEVTITGAASSGVSYSITSMSVTPLTRQMMSEACFRKMGFNESTAYPFFDKSASGFLSASDDLTFTFSVPRELYDMEIMFEGQTENIGFSGNYSDSLWTTDRSTSLYAATTEVDSCGSETWAADIPWTSMTGVFTSVESFDQNSTVVVDNENEDYYVFIATMNITAKEKIVAISDLSNREWPLERTMHWKYPFALKWMRDIAVSSDLEVHVCTSSQTICTIRHVTAIISYIQTEINPIAELSGSEIGTVTVGIKTLVAYPYMFIHDEDPEFNGTSIDQISNSSLTNYTYSDAVSGWMPEVSYSPDTNEDTGAPLEVAVSVAFTFEDRSSCEHDTTQSVNAQADAECEQNWALTITPQAGSCFINGNYTITWSARCFYDKPVCNFPANDAGTGYNNYVSSTLELESTRMCPRLVQDVDLSGALCSTGLAVEGADYTSGCDSDPTYIQGESTHFYAQISSDLAKIVKTEVTRIQFSQSINFTLTDPKLTPRYDDNLINGTYIDIFTEADSGITVNFQDQDGNGAAASDLVVVEQVQNSDACLWDYQSSCVDAGFTAQTEAGFRINLNALVFPAPADGNSEVHFRTVLRTTYEGFEDFGLEDGVLEGDVLGGTDDAQWCTPTLNNDYAGSVSTFCDNHPADDIAAECPSICGAGRRRLFTKEYENRRSLQQQTGSATPIEDGSDDELFETTINVQSAKAQVTGHINDLANQVDFTMSMIIDDSMLHDYNTARPTFYEEMEYQLGTVLGALTEQFTVHSIQRVDHGNQPALDVEVQIRKLDGLEDTQYLPSSIVKRLELLIQTGRLYDEDFFHLTAVYNMEYHENDETPHKVHFGEVDPVEGMPDDSVYTISLAFVCILFGLLW